MPTIQEVQDFAISLNPWLEEEGIDEDQKTARVEAVSRIVQAYQEDSTRLNLSGLSITSLPAEIGNLVKLTELDLSDNRLTTLPERIGDLTALTDLNLSLNQLTTLPESIGGLTALTYLNLYGNQLTTLPERIGDLTALTNLNLSHNRLNTLPEQIGDLTALTYLNLYGNQLTTLPERIWDLTALKVLSLGRNQLTTIPERIGNLTALTDLNLHGNQLTTLPERIGDLTALTNLSLSFNRLTALPESIGGLNALRYLYLSHNQLTTLPERIGNLTALTNLYLSGNQLTTLPERIGNLTALTMLYLQRNQLTSLPNSIFTNPARTSEIDIPAENNRFLAAEASRLNTLAQQNPLVRLGISIHELPVAAFAPEAIINEIITQSLGDAAVTESDFKMSRSILANTSLGGFHTFLGQCTRTASWEAEGETKKNLCKALYGIMQKIDQNPDLAETVNLTSIGSDTSCGDRVAITLAQLQIATMFDGKKPEEMDLVEMYKYAEANAVVKFLNDKAAERFAPRRTDAARALAPNGTDAVETYLAYYHVLPMVGIQITGIDMLFRFCANVTDEHLKSAKAELERESSVESLTHQQYLTFKAMADDENFQAIPFVKDARSEGKIEEEALHKKLEAALLGGTSGEAEKQSKEIEKKRIDLIVKNLAKSYQVSLSPESVTTSQTEVITSEEAKERSYKYDYEDEESRSSSEERPSFIQEAGGTAAKEREATAEITEASRERAEEPRVGETARETFMKRVCDSLSNTFGSSSSRVYPDSSVRNATSAPQPLTSKRNKVTPSRE